MKEDRVFIYDTETTGFTEPQVVEAAYLEIVGDPNDMWINESWQARFCPSKQVELGALSTHHILDHELEGLPASETFKPPFENAYVIGHNVDYDLDLLGDTFSVKRICTLAMSRHLFPHLDSHNQSAMLYHFRGRTEETRSMLRNAHSAEQDVDNCFYVLKGILDKHPVSSWEELYQFSEIARVPTVMAFGKYKGYLIKDLPQDYVNWYLRQTEKDPYMEQALRARGR